MRNDQQVPHQKQALRAEIRERRRSTPQVAMEASTASLTNRLIDFVTARHVTSLSCYLSNTFEPNTRPFLAWARRQHIRALLPITREDGLLDWVVDVAGSESEPGSDTAEPAGEVLSPLAVNDVDLMLIPACAVDERGMRLGWGRGYFDKTIGSMENAPPIFALIFDNEFVDAVPTELHDQRVHGVITPSRTITF